MVMTLNTLREIVRHPGRNSRHGICESVLEWALLAPGAHVERIRPSYTVDREAPHTIDGRVHPYFASFPSEYVVPEKYLACIPGGRVLGKRGLVVLPDGSFSAESIYDVSQLLMAPELHKRLPTAERYQPGNYYSLPIWGSEIGGRLYWYHWIHDVVLRLHEIVDRLPPDTRFIVPPNRRPVQDELLALVGVGADRLWEWDGRGVLRLENLYFSPPSPPSGIDSPETDVWLRNRALAAYGLELGPPRRRILVTRRSQDYHHISNEPEIEALLQDFGFEVHAPEQYSLKEQVARRWLSVRTDLRTQTSCFRRRDWFSSISSRITARSSERRIGVCASVLAISTGTCWEMPFPAALVHRGRISAFRSRSFGGWSTRHSPRYHRHRRLKLRGTQTLSRRSRRCRLPPLETASVRRTRFRFCSESRRLLPVRWPTAPPQKVRLHVRAPRMALLPRGLLL
jgi:hypothetical protein